LKEVQVASLVVLLLKPASNPSTDIPRLPAKDKPILDGGWSLLICVGI